VASNSGDDNAPLPSPLPPSTCKLYLATSTIPNAGLGVFTSVPMKVGDAVGFGDSIVTIVDMDFNADGFMADEDYHWLPSEYMWNGAKIPHMKNEGQEVHYLSSGMGSLANCHLNLNNVVEKTVDYGTAGITRGDPGVGAFSSYHDRRSYIQSNVQSGQELFVSYGANWFLTREDYMGLFPMADSYPIADKFVKRMEKMIESIATIDEINSTVLADVWDMILQSPYKSRPLSALPKTFQLAQRAMEVGIKQTEVEQTILPVDYLEKHGKCLDNIRPGNSTIDHAGRGAFATRFLASGSLIAPVPLLHIPDRDVLQMYEERFDEEVGYLVRDASRPFGKQLLLNYCFGHNQSSMLLCPYSYGVQLINHNSESPNAKIIWSEDPMYHNASWLEEPMSFFDNAWSSGVAFEYIALRDIEEGEEVTINYGKDWEDAWNEHLNSWMPEEGVESYIPPRVLNADETTPLRTRDEDPTMYGNAIDVHCNVKGYSEGIADGEYVVLSIVDRSGQGEEGYLYTLRVILEPGGTAKEGYKVEAKHAILRNVPRKAVTFYHKKYRSEMFVEGTFRHEMMIDDIMFPDAWRNLDSVEYDVNFPI
jgi:hypothetical protein